MRREQEGEALGDTVAAATAFDATLSFCFGHLVALVSSRLLHGVVAMVRRMGRFGDVRAGCHIMTHFMAHILRGQGRFNRLAVVAVGAILTGRHFCSMGAMH